MTLGPDDSTTVPITADDAVLHGMVMMDDRQPPEAIVAYFTSVIGQIQPPI